MCCWVAVQSLATPSDKERQRLTKSRRATVTSSKPSEAKITKTATSSSDVESSEAEVDGKVGRKTSSRRGNKTAAASLAATTVRPRCLYFYLLFFVITYADDSRVSIAIMYTHLYE